MQGIKSNIDSYKYEKEIIERILKNIKINETNCWEWLKCTNQNNYGVIRAKRRNYLVHRLIFEIIKKQNIKGKLVCHTCDNPLCCNPDHMFIGTQTENMKDAQLKKRMKQGEKHYRHKLTIKNLEEIRLLLKNGNSIRKIALIFNVSASCIAAISSGRNWKK